MQRVEGTGSVAPGQMGGHKPKAISGEHAAWLSQRIKDDDTLAIARHHQTGAVIAKRFSSVRVPDHARKTLNIRRKSRRHVPRFCQTISASPHAESESSQIYDTSRQGPRHSDSVRPSSLLKNLEMKIFLILAGRCRGGVVELDVIF
jgi:hypothetical protein